MMSEDIGNAVGGAVFGESRRSRSQRWRGGDDISSRASETWDDMQDRGSRALSQKENSAEDAYYATRRYVYDHPMQAMLGVTALAFAVGALWRLGSRDRSYGPDLFQRFSDYMEPQARSARRRW